MGNFFTSTQIYNPEGLNKEKFFEVFCEKMNNDGYESCDDDSAELSYVFHFGGKWVSVGSEKYEEGNDFSNNDAGRIAKMLSTFCMNTTVIDSDCAVIDLYDKTGKKTDTAIMGRADDHFGNDVTVPKKNCWSHIIAEDKTFDEFNDVFSRKFIFAEDGLAKLASILDMDIQNIMFTYGESNDDTCSLSFRKAGKKEKEITLNAAFKKVFGNALEPLGFVKVKSKYPYYVRIINNEILHIITYRNYTNKPNYKVFDIECGVATIYRRKINFDLFPKSLNWLSTNWWIYTHTNEWNDDPESEFRKFRDSIYRFSCDTKKIPLIKEFEHALDVTKQVMLPLLDKIYDLESCIKYRYLTRMKMSLYYADVECDFGNNINGHESDEGLLYFKVSPDICKNNLNPTESETIKKEKENYDKIISDPFLLEQTFHELDLRRESNMKKLEEYHLI